MHVSSRSGEAGVTVIGLGAMGAALVRALLASGRDVVVWNRSAEKAAPLVRDGARLAADVDAAVRASAVVIICVTDYAVTRALLGEVALAGRTLVQLSTGTPQEAREAAAWASARGAQYLDGAILAVPAQVGRPESTIFVSGAAAAFAAAGPALTCLAGSVRLVGERPGDASAFDLGFLACLFGALLGSYHGARVFESEGLGVDALGAMLAAVAPAIGQMIAHDADTVHTGDYAAPGSSLAICGQAMDLLARQAREAGLEASFPDFAAGLFRRGVAAGLGDESPAALVKLLRAGPAQGTTSTYAGKRAVVLGGTHGIGLATVRQLLAGGAEVLLTGRDERNAAAARAELGDRVLRSDIASTAEIAALVDQVRERLGTLDLVFINAGVAELEGFERITEASYDRTFAVNTRGAFFSAQQLAPLVRPGGSIVFTTSIASTGGSAGMAVYSASKAALASFARVLAAELAARDIRVNAVSPGFVRTPTMGTAGSTAEQRAAFEREGEAITPMRRIGAPEEVARAVLFLAFDATFTTGIELAVDGGLGQGLHPPHE